MSIKLLLFKEAPPIKKPDIKLLSPKVATLSGVTEPPYIKIGELTLYFCLKNFFNFVLMTCFIVDDATESRTNILSISSCFTVNE